MPLLRINQPALTRVTQMGPGDRYIMPNVKQFDRMPGWNPQNQVAFYMPLKVDLSIPIGDGPATFTRASKATYIYEGKVKDALVDQARFEAAGYLSEGASTNETLHSESQDEWDSATGIITARPEVIDPRGRNTVFSIVGTDGGSFPSYSIVGAGLSTSVDTTMSGWCRADGMVRSAMRCGTSSDHFRIVVNWNSLTFEIAFQGNGTVTSGSLVDVGGGWFFFTVTGIPNTAVSEPASTQCIPTNNNSGSSNNVSGETDGIKGNVVWGCQVEALPFASSYIPTTAVAATRALDFLTAPVSNVPAFADDHSISVTANPLAIQGDFNRIYAFISSNRRAETSNTQTWQSGFGTFVIGVIEYVAGIGQRVLVTLDVNHRLFVDGVADGEEVKGTASEPIITFVIGGEVAARVFFGHLLDFSIYENAITPDNDFKGGGGVPL